MKMPESNPNEQLFLDTDAWELILESLDEEKCIVCLGPGVYSNPDEPRLEQQLASFLREQEESLEIRVYDDGWFHYLPDASKIRAIKKVKRFYKKENQRVENLFKKLSAIPFHFILNFVPDYKLKNSFENENFDFEFQSYIKKELSI